MAVKTGVGFGGGRGQGWLGGGRAEAGAAGIQNEDNALRPYG